jgi:hypothetical protein
LVVIEEEEEEEEEGETYVVSLYIKKNEKRRGY